MATLSDSMTPKERSLQVKEMISLMLPQHLYRVDEFVKEYFDCDDPVKMKLAHAMVSKIMDKGMANMNIIKHEGTGTIDAHTMAQLEQLKRFNDAKHINVEMVKEVEDEADEFRKIPSKLNP